MYVVTHEWKFVEETAGNSQVLMLRKSSWQTGNWVMGSEIFRLYVLTCLLFCVCVANKCFPLKESWQEVANYCSGCLISPRCAPPAGSAGLETHLNVDQAPGRTAWGPGPLACSRVLLIGTEPSCQYHSSTWTWWLLVALCLCLCEHLCVLCVCARVCVLVCVYFLLFLILFILFSAFDIKSFIDM